MSQFRLRVYAINFPAILGYGSKWDDEIEVPSQALLGVIDVFNERFNILFTTLIKWHNHKLGATCAVPSVHGLIVFGNFPGEPAGGNNNLCTTAD